MIEEIKEQISRQRNKFATSDEACKTLEEKGFIPIKIAMMYGRGGINFANAIVHQNDDGLVYITNSTETESEFYNAFQEYFERDLLKKCPQIKRTYFISGNKIGKDLNDMMVYLKDFKGGIHCLCCEEMET